MLNIINKLIFFFKCLYSLFKFIFFKGLMGTRLIYESSNRNVCTLNDEFELIHQGHETTVIVTVENKNRNENQFGAQKVIKKIFNYIPILHARDSYILFLNVACF